MARVISLLFSLILLVSVALVAGGGHKGGKKGGGYEYVAPQKVIILQAGPSVTYPWAGFCGPKGKCKKIPKLPRPPFPSFLPPAPPLPAYAPAPYNPPSYAPPAGYAPQAPAYIPEAPVHHQAPQYAPEPHVPSYSQPAPEVQYQAPEVQYQAPEVQYQAPEVHHHAAPEVQYQAPEVHHQAPEVHHAPEVHQQPAAPAGLPTYVAPAGAPPAPEYVPPAGAAAPVYQQDAVQPLSSYQVAPVPTFDVPEPRPASFNSGAAVSSNSWGPVDGPFGGQSEEGLVQGDAAPELNGGYANSAPVTVPPVYNDAAVQNEGQTWDAPPVPLESPDDSQLWADQSSFQSHGAPAQEELAFQDDYAQPSESQQFGTANLSEDPFQDEFQQDSAQDFLPVQEEESIQQEYAPSADGFGSRIRPRGNLQDRQF